MTGMDKSDREEPAGDDADVHQRINQLEQEIERHAVTIERCRKVSLVSRVAIGMGAVIAAGESCSVSSATMPPP